MVKQGPSLLLHLVERRGQCTVLLRVGVFVGKEGFEVLAHLFRRYARLLARQFGLRLHCRGLGEAVQLFKMGLTVLRADGDLWCLRYLRHRYSGLVFFLFVI